MKRKTLFFYAATLFCITLPGVLSAKVKFGNADINRTDEVLYTVKHDIPGTNSYRSLFKAKIVSGEFDGDPELLTCFPEQMEMLSGSSILQIRNRYGTAWINTISKSFSWKQFNPKIPLNSMRLAKNSPSPDGAWICFIEKTGYATGRLYLQNVNSGKKFLLDEKAAFNYEKVPVKWLSDSSVLLYAKENFVYFCNPEAVARGVEVSEEFRKIGPGTINSVNWVNGRYLVYIDSDLVYKISAKELYTMGLYSGIIGKGMVVGRLPAQFQPNKDFFSVNGDVSGMVLVQNGKVFTYFAIEKRKGDYLEIMYSGPYIDMQASLLESEIIWNDNEIPSLWLRRLPYNGEKILSSVYRLDDKLIKFLEIEDSGFPAISADGTKCAFFAGTTVHVYDTVGWKRINKIDGENIASLVWEDSNVLWIGGDRTIRRWNVFEEKAETIVVTSAVNGFYSDSGQITADAGNGRFFTFDESTRTWSEALPAIGHENHLQNGRYRLFCGESPNKDFENTLYIRTLAGKAITKAAYPESVKKVPDSPKVALVFDAYDNADGLTRILYTMDKYNLTGTFFLNGEFIRRYPNETRQIASSGNECASMFFSTAELTQEGFVLNEDYIRRGLARTEDEFNMCTKKELSLMWHAPAYKSNAEIVKWGRAAGYKYATTKQRVFDTVTMEKAVTQNERYYSPCALIDSYMKMLSENQGGTVAVTVGISRGSRESYMYDNLDLLLSAILDAGYEIVPLRYILAE